MGPSVIVLPSLDITSLVAHKHFLLSLIILLIPSCPVSIYGVNAPLHDDSYYIWGVQGVTLDPKL